MKIILSIIFMFLSTQSFADLTGKGLICTFTDSGFTEYKPRSFYFTSTENYERRIITEKNDKFKILLIDESRYKTDKDFISLWGNEMKVNRKTLKYVSMNDGFGTLGYCEVFDNFKKLDKAYTKIKNKYQEEYNKTLEGNKI